MATTVATQTTAQKLEDDPQLPLDTQSNLVYVLTRIFRQLAQVVNPMVAGFSQLSTKVSQLPVQPTLRNLFDNGNFNVNQINTGVVLTTQGAFFCDRWRLNNAVTARISGQQAATALVNTGAVNKALFTVTATGAPATTEYYGMAQSLENLVSSQLLYGNPNARTATLSFVARSSVGGTFAFSLRSQGPNYRSFVRTFTLAAGVITPLSFVIPGDTATGSWVVWQGTAPGQSVADLNLYVSLGCGATYTTATLGAWQDGNFIGAIGQTQFTTQPVGSTVEFWSVQLELGSVATQFETLPFSYELQRAKRFFEVIGNSAVGEVFCPMFARNTVDAYGILQFETKRAVPVFSFSAASDFQFLTSSGVVPTSSIGVNASTAVSPRTVGVDLVGTLTAGQAGWLQAVQPTARIFINAQL